MGRWELRVIPPVQPLLLAFALGGVVGAGSGYWLGDRLAQSDLAELRVELVRRDLAIESAGRGAEQHARAVEAVHDAITRETDHAYQKEREHLRRVPADRLRQLATAEPLGHGIRAHSLPGATGRTDAAPADPVPDSGCDRLAVDAAETTLMLWHLQTWAKKLEAEENLQ